MPVGYFDCKRDRAIEKAGGFWCEACLASHPITEQSKDPRYCQNCYEFLLEEASLLNPKRGHPEWMPQIQKRGKNLAHVRQQGGGIMSIVENTKTTMDINKPSVRRGRPRGFELPEEKIKEMSEAGIGSRAIAGRLKAEFGINISYKTIQRLLAKKERNEL